MRTIAIINQKGGCGKTTVSINLAAVLAAQGHRTLLVDMDPQSHCALGLAVPEAQIEKSMADLLLAGFSGPVTLPDIVWQISRNLDLAPSTMSLAAVEMELASAADRDRRLTQLLSTVADHYDICIIDCPPSIGLLTFNALRAAQEVIVPVETGYFAMQGSVKQDATIDMLARRANHRIRLRVLATMYDVRTKLAREILSELRKHFSEKLLPVVINFNSKLKEAASFGQAITEYDPASKGMQDFDKLVAWLMANPPEPAEAVAASPALSRAAELVERAKALSARTAALAARLAADTDIATEHAIEPITPAPPPPSPRPSAEPRPTATPAPPGFATVAAPRAAGSAAPAAPPPSLDQKLARVYGVRVTSQGLLFVQPAPTAQEVAIAGDFNNWNPAATPLKRDASLGVWQACVSVPPGRYRYRLVIDGRWVKDPYNTCVESNPFGELNSVVEMSQGERVRSAT